MPLERLDNIADGINFLSIYDLISINKFLIELQTPNEHIFVRDKNLLASSQSRPYQYRHYNQIEDMFVLSSVLIESIIKNHPFANANKRTAMASGCLFLLLNGWEVYAPDNGIVEIAEGVAIGKYTREDLENWLCLWSREFDSRNLCINSSMQIEEFLMKVYPVSK